MIPPARREARDVVRGNIDVSRRPRYPWREVAPHSSQVLECLVRYTGLWQPELCLVFHPTMRPPCNNRLVRFGPFVNGSYAVFDALCYAFCTPVYPIERAFGRKRGG